MQTKNINTSHRRLASITISLVVCIATTIGMVCGLVSIRREHDAATSLSSLGISCFYDSYSADNSRNSVYRYLFGSGGAFCRVAFVDCHRRNPTPVVCRDISRLHCLRIINLEHTTTSDESLVYMAIHNLPLQMLNLRGTQVTDASAKLIGGCGRITSLNLAETQMGDESARRIALLPNLTSLAIGPRISMHGLHYLKDHIRLRQLTLIGCNISKECIDAFRSDRPDIDLQEMSR